MKNLRAILANELFRLASGPEKALTAADLYEQIKAQYPALSAKLCSDCLSGMSRTTWSRWIKRDWAGDSGYKYHFIMGAKPPKLSDSGKLERKHFTRSAPRSKGKALAGNGESPAPYKLEINGPGTIISQEITREQLRAIMETLLQEGATK